MVVFADFETINCDGEQVIVYNPDVKYKQLNSKVWL
jgi:hypothetical protein